MKFLASLVIALYAGYALYTVFPYRDQFGGSTLIAFAAYAAFTAAAFFAIQKLAGSIYLRLGNGGVVILILATLGFGFALAFHSFGLSNLYHFPPLVLTYVATREYFFWWFIAPLVALLALGR